MEALSRAPVEKCPTGIAGFDEISFGGVPRGRPTLVAGHAGSGKTLFALEFVLNGIEEFAEPGVFATFEESAGELATNVGSLGYDVPDDLSDAGTAEASYESENRLDWDRDGEETDPTMRRVMELNIEAINRYEQDEIEALNEERPLRSQG